MAVIELPDHALRYLLEMCKRERKHLNRAFRSLSSHGLASEAAYDSLNTIECAVPPTVGGMEIE